MTQFIAHHYSYKQILIFQIMFEIQNTLYQAILP